MDTYVSFGCSVIGPGHIKTGKPNQDSFLLKKYKNGWVAVVSDGVGSKPLSHTGSAAVCSSVCNVMRDYLNSPKSVDIKDVLIQQEKLLSLIVILRGLNILAMAFTNAQTILK